MLFYYSFQRQCYETVTPCLYFNINCSIISYIYSGILFRICFFRKGLDMVKEFVLQNWAILLILLAFLTLLRTTGFINKKSKDRMYTLILWLLLLDLTVFFEFYFEEKGIFQDARLALMAVRYSATPLIIAFIIFTMAIYVRWYVFIPAMILAAINIISIFTGIVFSLDENGSLHRGALGYLPYIMVGGYCALLVFILLRRSNKRYTEIFPIIFLCFSFVCGLLLPFALGKDYSRIFCTNMVIAIFIYYVFSILQLTEKDSLTGLMNRQAFYASVESDAKNITALVSIDMNGLKTINDSKGHAAGDKALQSVAICFLKSITSKNTVYRIGGDEFVILCRHSGEDEVKQLIERIQKNLSKTEYKCAVGYSFHPDGSETIDDMLKESDEKMYEDKKAFYCSKVP